MDLRIHARLPLSEVNGPGRRYVIWVQGCGRNCPGCFNPETHPSDGGTPMTVDALLDEILQQQSIEGITVSGGEPFEQSPALEELFRGIREASRLSILVFTGFTLDELERNPGPESLLSMIDLLIAGPYRDGLKTGNGLLTSSNQRMHFLSNRYSPLDLAAGDCEIHIDERGDYCLTGCNPII